MQPLDHIRTAMDNIAVQGRDNRGSVILDMADVPILRDLAFLTHSKQIHASSGWVKGVDNTMADAASILTHLPNRMFHHHFPSLYCRKILGGCSPFHPSAGVG